MEQQTSFEKAHALVEHIFRALLPEYGLMIREAQIELCHEMLDTLFEGKIALCDAGVGIGKNARLSGSMPAVAAVPACTSSGHSGDLHIQHCAAGSDHERVHPIFIACAFAGGDTGTPHLCSSKERERAVRMRSKTCGAHGAGAHKNKCQQTAGGFASEFGKNI